MTTRSGPPASSPLFRPRAGPRPHAPTGTEAARRAAIDGDHDHPQFDALGAGIDARTA